ncbi:MAG: extracellular solute-binding protein, partial [Chloroflexi bacterium]|nr:extracellular solute-binding protein [Chloroflexota bacterium]
PTPTPIPTPTPTISYAGQKIVGYSWGGDVDTGMAETACKNLRLKFGGECSLVPGSSVGNLSKAIAEKTDPQADFLRIDEALVEQAKANGVAVKLDYTKLPNSKDLFKGMPTYGDYFLPHMIALVTISYRTDKITKKITKWADLWDPDFKGKVTIADFSYNFAYTLLEAAARLTGDPKNLDAGFEKIKQLKPNICRVSTSTVMLQNMLTTGECPIAVLSGARSYPLVDKGLPVAVTHPEDFPATQVSGIIMLREKNKGLMYLFMNELLDARVLAQQAEYLSYGPTASTASQYMPVAQRLRSPDTQEEFNKAIFPDWDFLNKRRPEFTDRFNKEIAK